MALSVVCDYVCMTCSHSFKMGINTDPGRVIIRCPKCSFIAAFQGVSLIQGVSFDKEASYIKIGDEKFYRGEHVKSMLRQKERKLKKSLEIIKKHESTLKIRKKQLQDDHNFKEIMRKISPETYQKAVEIIINENKKS